MPRRIRARLEQLGLLPPPGSTIMAAVSGGADSMCLLHMLTALAPDCCWQVCAAHFNHMLRGAEADRDEQFVCDYCRKAGIPFRAGRGNVAACAAEHHLSTEEAGRRLRYDFLEEARLELGADYIATAHNADDNAETILMNLTRGTGTAGLQGIPPIRGRILRPLLCMTREDIEAYDRANNIPWVNDSTNDEDLYTRNRIRHQVMPVLRSINPRFAEAALRLSDISAADEAALSGLAEEALAACTPAAGPEESPACPIDILTGLPEAVAARALRRLSGRPLSHDHIESLMDLCRSGADGSLDLPGCRARLSYGLLSFGPPAPESFAPMKLTENMPVEPTGSGLRITLTRGTADGQIHKSFTEYLFKSTEVYGKITVRPRLPGDCIRLRGRGCTKSLKKLYNEARIAPWRRGCLPVITDEAGILAAYPFGPAERGRPEDGCPVIRIQIQEIKPHAE